MAASNIFPKGSTSKIIEVTLRSSTTGQPVTGIAFGSVTIKEHRQGASPTTRTAITMTAGTWASIGWVETSDAGIYQFGVPNAGLSTGADAVVYSFTATGAITAVKEIVLSDPVRGVGSPTALPNAAADAAGGLPISDAGGLDIDAKLANTNEITAARMGALTDWIDGGRLDLLLDATLADTNELQGDWANGGRLDLIIDAILVDTGTTIPGLLPDNFADLAIAATTGIVSANMIQISGDSTAADNLEAAADGTGYNLGGGSIVAASVTGNVGGIAGTLNTLDDLNAGLATEAELADAVHDEALAGHTTAGTAGKALSDIVEDTAEIGAAGAGLTDIGGFSTTAKSQINTEADTALTDYDPPTRAELTTDTDSVIAQIADVYHADIQFTRDQGNTTDEFSVVWFKNGVRITSGITSPTIQVVKRSDGTDLVASTAMTQIGSTGAYKHDEDTNRITVGEAVVVVVGATIDDAARSFARVIGRDSSE